MQIDACDKEGIRAQPERQQRDRRFDPTVNIHDPRFTVRGG